MRSADSTSACWGGRPILQDESIPTGGLLGELIGGVYPEKAKLLGQRTGELHQALASSPDDRGFRARAIQRAFAALRLSIDARSASRKTFDLLREESAESAGSLPGGSARRFLPRREQILAREQRILEQRAARRKSGFTAITISGRRSTPEKISSSSISKANRPDRLSERKLKRSALRDVAGMMRSFQYAAYCALWQPAMRPEDIPFLERWADTWYRQMSSVFLQSYLRATAGASFIPRDEDELQVLLEAYLLDKAVYEVGYELNNRPDWVVIPIRGIKHILQKS